jgi:hypothetical protein
MPWFMADQNIQGSPTTTYNISLTTSVEYEKRQAESWDLSTDSEDISKRVGLDRVNPSAGSKTDQLFNLDKKNQDFSLIKQPKGFGNQTGRLFTHQLAPAFSSVDTLLDRVDDIEEGTIKKLDSSLPAKDYQAKISTIQNEAKTLKLAFSKAKEIQEGIQSVIGNRTGFQKV